MLVSSLLGEKLFLKNMGGQRTWEALMENLKRGSEPACSRVLLAWGIHGMVAQEAGGYQQAFRGAF